MNFSYETGETNIQVIPLLVTGTGHTGLQSKIKFTRAEDRVHLRNRSSHINNMTWVFTFAIRQTCYVRLVVLLALPISSICGGQGMSVYYDRSLDKPVPCDRENGFLDCARACMANSSCSKLELVR